MKQKLRTFRVGTVLNSLKHKPQRVRLRFKTIELRYPTRLNAMAIDPSLIDINDTGIYTAGEVVFSTKLFKRVSVEKRNDEKIVVTSQNGRPQLILHAALIMRKALGVKQGFNIHFDVANEIKHVGLGSSSGTIAAVASAINELYGKPISPKDLIKYLAQNHGEEIDEDRNSLQHVQCIGGSAVVGLVKAGMIILTGTSAVVAQMQIPNNYHVIIGIPNGFRTRDAKTLMELEVKAMAGFIKTGKRYGSSTAYSILHKTIPAMVDGNLKAASQIIFDYRFHFGSINNCSFVYPPMKKIAKEVAPIFMRKDVFTLSISSVGPAFFVITTNKGGVVKFLRKLDMSVITTKINNEGYRVLHRKSL